MAMQLSEKQEHRFCTRCKEEKPFSEFEKCVSKGFKYGIRPDCKACRKILKAELVKKNPEKYKQYKKNHYSRNREKIILRTTEYSKAHPEIRRKIMLKHQYGISEEFYNSLNDKQNGFCAICGIKPKLLYVDHCHSTEKIRGLLCLKCNSMLGFCNDNIDILNNAILYLSKE